MRNCFVPHCDAYCKKWKKRMMFSPPKGNVDIFLKWKAAMKNGKRELRLCDRVCQRHFDESDIITSWDHIINGVVHKLDRSKPKLKADAIPQFHLGDDETVKPKKASSSKPKKKRKSDEENEPDQELAEAIETIKEKPKRSKRVYNQKTDNSKENIEIIEETATQSILDVGKEETEAMNTTEIITTVVENEFEDPEITEKFENLYDDIFEVTLPNTLWALHRDPDNKFIAFSMFDIKLLGISKLYLIYRDLKTKTFIRDKVMDEQKITSVDTEFISSILSDIDGYILCKGVYENSKECNYIVPQNDITLSNRQLCNNCKKSD